jgi:hypothetical protein
MDRTFWIAALCAFVVAFVLGFFFHGVLLYGDYDALKAVYRGPELKPFLFALLILAQLIMAAAMVAIYRFGRQDKPFLGQGARFGLLIACASVIPCYLIGYVVLNVPGALAVKQIVLETVTVVAMGVVVAWFHRA